MKTIAEKIVKLQDADLKLINSTNRETSLFLGDISEKLSFVDQQNFEFYVNKENILKSLCFAFSFSKPFYNVKLTFEWFSHQFQLMNDFFKGNADELYTTTFVLQTQDRRYLKGLKQKTGFNIRNFLIQDHSVLEFNEDNKGKIHLMIRNTENGDLQPDIYLFDGLVNTPRQKIIYGAPGTGKSYELQRQVTEDLKILETNTKRVTFHPNYSYQQFIGTYKPTPIYKDVASEVKLYNSTKREELSVGENKEPIIDYTFVPGPFLSLLIEAMKEENREIPYMLIIEEINRASVASVFGDIFQLLDRDKDGTSEYEIEFNADVTNYLISRGIDEKSIRIPNNLFIWATMNSADQGVMPLDSAFKRRWSFEYLELDKKADVVSKLSVKFLDQEYSWNKFRNILNDKLISLSIPEDKLIGPFFLKESELKDNNAIKNKLLIYLKDDVVRHNPETLFTKRTFSGIIKEYDAGKNVFVDLDLSDAVFSEKTANTEENSESE